MAGQSRTGCGALDRPGEGELRQGLLIILLILVVVVNWNGHSLAEVIAAAGAIITFCAGIDRKPSTAKD